MTRLIAAPGPKLPPYPADRERQRRRGHRTNWWLVLVCSAIGGVVGWLVERWWF